MYRSGPHFTKGRKSYDFRLILRPLTDQVCDRFTKLVGMVFFTIYELRLVVVKSSLCGGTKIDQFTRAAHLSAKFIIRSKKILNTFILMVYVDTKNIKYSNFFGVM